ncbi:5580_t:CDS:2 [Cetraspora pellucida]|uniref:5580_t:CDS:1 n=1 Tax=Cetraspora pellucida TaxID=1433469 RepID=A0A9N8VF51_9GLOM|nr:5580_t:CDS:2 [Cetraspora pellucida]
MLDMANTNSIRATAGPDILNYMFYITPLSPSEEGDVEEGGR